MNEIVDKFHDLYYNSPDTWGNTFYKGIPILKCPMDLWIYHEILWEVQPDIVIETGTAHGGSALFIADQMDMIGKGKVITVDNVRAWEVPPHQRIDYYIADSVTLGSQFDFLEDEKVMVILDSDHTGRHVYKEMLVYSNYVTKGSYMIVEDGNINGHPVLPGWGWGPQEAIEEFFLARPGEFEIDKSREKFMMTFNPNGFLKKV